jgi:hypothetical protein
MYGLGRFNLARYNLTHIGNALEGKSILASVFDSLLAVSQDAQSSLSLRGVLNMKAGISAAILADQRLTGVIGASARLFADAPTDVLSPVAWQSFARCSMNSFTSNVYALQLSGKWHSSVNGSYAMSGVSSAAVVAGRARLVRDHYTDTIYLTALFDGQLALTNLQTAYITLYAPIPPGGKLILDSDNYTAYLDGVNVLHYLADGWLRVDRDMFDVRFDAVSPPQLSARVLYTERWI